MARIKLENGAADIIMQLTAKLWQIRGGQRPTYETTVNTIFSGIDDDILAMLIAKHDVKRGSGDVIQSTG